VNRSRRRNPAEKKNLKKRYSQNGEHRGLDLVKRRVRAMREDEIDAALPSQSPKYQGLQKIPVSLIPDDFRTVELLKKRFQGLPASAQPN
jgi:hypothetical protein